MDGSMPKRSISGPISWMRPAMCAARESCSATPRRGRPSPCMCLRSSLSWPAISGSHPTKQKCTSGKSNSSTPREGVLTLAETSDRQHPNVVEGVSPNRRSKSSQLIDQGKDKPAHPAKEEGHQIKGFTQLTHVVPAAEHSGTDE